MQNGLRKFASFATFAVIAFTGATTSQAQTYTCTIVDGCKLIITYDADGNIIDKRLDCGSTGSGTFSSNESPISKEGPIDSKLDPSDISATVQDEELGTITTSLDASRSSTTTTLTSNTKDERFPATLKLNFYATASAEAKPDSKYASRTELNFASENIQSANPFEKETLTLQNDVEFYDTDDKEQRTVFTLNAGETQVTLGK